MGGWWVERYNKKKRRSEGERLREHIGREGKESE